MESSHPLREAELMMTRRQLFGRSALGLGTLALSDLFSPSGMASQETPPWVGDASQGQGQAGDLLVHERWPKSSGFVGLQAQAQGTIQPAVTGSCPKWTARYRDDRQSKKRFSSGAQQVCLHST